MSIFSDYNDFEYIYPPRPETAISPDRLNIIDTGWIAQPKYNGSCSVLFINGRKGYKIYNRSGEELTLQKPISYTELNDSDKYMVLCGEYLNKSKCGEDGKLFNHKFVIWDILVRKGEYLVGSTFEDRLIVLYKLFGSSRGFVSDDGITMFNHLHTTPVKDVFMAPTYQNNFKKLFDEIVQIDLYEGLVFKRKLGKLELGRREKNNSGWQVKTRKGTKNYSF